MDQRKETAFDAAIFDLDGTLLDSLEDLCDSVNFALNRLDFPQRSLEEVRRFVGDGVGNLVKRALPPQTQEQTTEECLALFREYYNKHKADKTRPYPGILELLSTLKQRGTLVAVVTNKYEAAARELCGTYFGDLPDAVVGEREGFRRKPAPDGVLEALRLLKSAPERTLYIGDSGVDMETARNAGLTSAGVLWGFRDREELLEKGARFLVDDPEELGKLISGTAVPCKKE